MRNYKIVLLPMLGMMILYACSRKVVHLDYTNAKGDVQQLGNLVFRFDKPLVKDSLLNNWDSTEYISFEPAIPGRFRWEQPDQLVFSPSRPLPPATTFKAKLKNDILQYSSYDKLGKSDNVVFSTPALKLDNSNVSWQLPDERSTTAIPQVDLYFNYPVNPSVIKEKLSIEVAGKRVELQLQTLSDDNKISFRLTGMKLEDKDLESKVIVQKGLVPTGGVNGTPENIEQSFSIPSPFNLSINDISAEHNGTAGTVYVRTSQQMAMENLSSYIKVDPSIKYSVEQTDDGFAISSEHFEVAKTYLLTLNKGLRGRIGGVLREQYDHNIAFGELEPSISFGNSKGVYLSSKGNEKIELRIINVPRVKVLISKIYESNILTAQRYGFYPDDSRYDHEEEYASYEGAETTMGDVIYEKEIETRLLPKYGNSRLFTFNVEDRLADFKGIYHIKVRSTDNYWISDSRFISKSDIGMIAKEGRHKIVVFANSIKTAKAINGVSMVAYGANNQVLGMGTTNADGVAEINYTKKDVSGFRPAMIIAKSEEDFNYLPFGQTKVNTSRFEVGGKRMNSTGLDAFIYAERDIYRPGEKVNFSVIVRDRSWKTPGELPVKMKFLLPNGKELKSFRKTLNQQGSLEGDVDISTSAITGSYSLEVYSSNDILLGSKPFNVEEFVPDRIKVTAKLDKLFLLPGQSTNLAINAVNFFGPPASGRNYETEIQIKQRNFSPKKFARFDFALSNQKSFIDKVVAEGTTDQGGNAVQEYTVPSIYKNMGVLQANFYATVFDETGRPVSRNTVADIYTQDAFFGIGDDGYWYYPLNQTVRFPIIAIDKNENVINGARTEIKIIKHEYRTVLTRTGSYFRYESQEDDKLITEQVVTVSGEATAYSFVPRTPGNYEIRIGVPGGATYVSKNFYSYGGWGTTSSFEVSAEGNVEIELDKSSYNAGENAKILFKTPFSGRMLVTFENDKLVSHQYVDVEKRSASIDVNLSADHLPNVYVTATLIKPHDISEIPLTVAHGFRNIRVEEKSRKMNVAITAQQKVRSNTRQKVKVLAEPGSFVTLAAVDNGVLQVTDFKTPDPYGHYYASRALEVNAYDLYPLLFPELRAVLSSTGGDRESSMKKRVNPMPAKRIKVVSYWSGITRANGNGEANFEFAIPQFSGQVRLMAVAYKDNSFGSNESAITVADPLVLSTAAPRFLSPGDTVSVPVTVTNTTSKAGNATASIKVTGPLKVAGNAQQTLTLQPNSESRAEFKIFAGPNINIGNVAIEVNGMGEKFVEQIELGVRPASPLQVLTGSGSLADASAQKVSINTLDFLPGSATYSLVISRSPALELGKQLGYLVQYPYGCTEQTISTAFPQLYFADLTQQMEVQSASAVGANHNVMEAIRRIKLRQLYNGAITLWDGEGTEHWWTSIYAAHFLIEAQKAGFEVDRSLTDGILGYINNRLKKKETIIYYYNQKLQKKIAPKEVAYSLYVLALAGKPNVSVMNYYKANHAILSLDSRYLLSVAYGIAGDKAKYRDFLPVSFTGEESVPQTGGSFYSDIRDESIALNALLDVDPANPQVPVMSKHVADKLKQRTWFNTQECAFSFVSLGKMASAANKATITADVKVNGKSIANVSNKPVKLTAKQLGGNAVDITTKGSGRIYYYWQSEGISASGIYKQEDNYIRVRRRFFDRYGRAIAGNTFNQNDLVIVQVTLEGSSNISNIVISDLLPAGFEIENPRTKEIPGMEWIKDAATVTALDVRDDRINLFVDLANKRQVYYYAVRAVSPGVYKLGPIAAEAMYNGEYHSYHGAGTITVNR